MKTKLLFAFIISLAAFTSKAQDAIVVSALVGNSIDSAEKKEHHILPYYSPSIFVSAVFIRNADSSITLKAQLKKDSIAEKSISKEEFAWIKNMIEGSSQGPDHFIYKFNKKMRVDYAEQVEKNGKQYLVGSGFYK